ncbi:Sperm flagellar protein 2 [Taenia crassiceps]|uniref:Sperm flagellar protein 2 n=1 Tax=Taenia crassiceps TaxID=6207 RepID=A0ABR4Q986_9CEST
MFFIAVSNEEIISQAVEGRWDTAEIALELAHADYALPSVYSFFHNKGCPIYEVTSTSSESVGSHISKLISHHLDGLRKQQAEAEKRQKADYKLDDEENSFISYCAANIGQDMTKRLGEIMEAKSTAFADQLQKVLAKLRHQRLHVVEHLCECRKILLATLRQPSSRQALVDDWQKEFNEMPLELLQDDVTKAERHFRLHELVIQLCDLTEKRRTENLALLREFFEHNEWHANKRASLINTYCLLLQMELDKWQYRNQVIGLLFESVGNTDVGKLENPTCYRLPMLKPPGLSVADWAAESKPKRRQTPGDEPSKGKVQTITYTAADFKTDDETDCPQLLFVVSETLTADEILPLIHANTKAKEVKRIKRSLEKRVPGGKTRRSGGRKIPMSPSQPNRYLLGSQTKPQEPELAFLYELATCGLKLVQLSLTEEQTKLGVCVDDNGDPLPRVEELPKGQNTARSHPTRKVKAVKKAAPTPESIKEPEQSEKLQEVKAIQLKLLKDEAERSALRLQLIRAVGLQILAKFEEDIKQFQTDGAQWIEAEYLGFQKSITSFKKYVQERIERGESLEYRLLIADNEPFCVSQEVTFTPKLLPNLHPFDQVIDESPQPENDYFDNLLKLVHLFRREAPHGCICEKAFVELVADNWEYDPTEVVKTFVVPQGTKSTGQSVVVYVDWRRFVVAAVLRMLDLSSNQLWVDLLALWSTVHQMTKSTLVGLRMPKDEVTKIISSEGVKLESKGCDVLISLFETLEEEGQIVKMDDLALFLAASGCSSPFDSLMRSLAALQTPALPLPTSQTTQVLYDLFNHPENGQELSGDFEVSKEVVQKIVDYVQIFIGSKECFSSDARLWEIELKEAFKETRSTGIPIHYLLHQPQFRAFCSCMLPYLYFPTLPC